MKPRVVSFLLSFVSGFVDTAGFIVLSGIFTAHITGNLVLAGALLIAEKKAEVWTRFLMLPIFIVGVVITFSMDALMSKTVKSSLRPLLLVQTLLIVAISGMGFFFEGASHRVLETLPILLTGTVGVLAMSVQNTYMKTHLPRYVPTTVMTGNMAQFSMDMVPWLLVKTKLREGVAPVESVRKFGVALLGFLAGAICAALVVSKIGLLSCLLPAMLLLVVMVLKPDEMEIKTT
ncbi:YoaK family protein [Chryseolinea lacunae]|uniref:DUF1275 domain-containing protein n=1 Tax=Chryseolinea lacunae TaxID=2801331 RepID=A0ABS1KN92_9BACT|nr:YoaK family protein [Chryseolinea lacunae]MBL0740943.1 DUF1275 domain-containing protein [Chryseolinea lacunae]